MISIRKIYGDSEFQKEMEEISVSFYEKNRQEIYGVVFLSSLMSTFFIFVSLFSFFYIRGYLLILPLANMILSFAAPFCVVYMLTNLAAVSQGGMAKLSSVKAGRLFIVALIFNWSFPAIRVKIYFLIGCLNLLISMHLLGVLQGSAM